jgi:aminoglycoside 3-N-acetyltransferase
MKEIINHYDYSDIEICFKKIGLKKNDSVFLSTNIGMLGYPKSKNKNKILTSSKWILKSIKNIIGKDGNIFVPTYSYSFTKKVKKFDLLKTKADIGYFPNFFLKQKNIVRSLDPMMSIAGIGPGVKNVLLKISKSSFGKNCAFERLFKIKNLKCCNIGLGYDWIPFMHYLDWQNNVPFRFDKIFKGKIIVNGKTKEIVIKWTYFARYLKKETLSNAYKIGYKG